MLLSTHEKKELFTLDASDTPDSSDRHSQGSLSDGPGSDLLISNVQSLTQYRRKSTPAVTLPPQTSTIRRQSAGSNFKSLTLHPCTKAPSRAPDKQLYASLPGINILLLFYGYFFRH